MSAPVAAALVATGLLSLGGAFQALGGGLPNLPLALLVAGALGVLIASPRAGAERLLDLAGPVLAAPVVLLAAAAPALVPPPVSLAAFAALVR
ncbi:MAG: hypothetical protein FJ034_02660, partial [Chloroflexi bacterium]|nr:hypothetical protein [Chloroflexota bacterium]